LETASQTFGNGDEIGHDIFLLQSENRWAPIETHAADLSGARKPRPNKPERRMHIDRWTRADLLLPSANYLPFASNGSASQSFPATFVSRR
jgi:hypothetical protein